MNKKEYDLIIEGIKKEIEEKKDTISNIEKRIVHNGKDDVITTYNEGDFERRKQLKQEVDELYKKYEEMIKRRGEVTD